MNSTGPTTKRGALRALGVDDGDERRRLASLVDLAHIEPGEALIGPRTPHPTVFVGLEGTISRSGGGGSAPTVRAPFVIDLWADELTAMGNAQIVAASRVTVLMIGWTSREALFTPVPHLVLLSRETERRLRTVSPPG